MQVMILVECRKNAGLATFTVLPITSVKKLLANIKLNNIKIKNSDYLVLNQAHLISFGIKRSSSCGQCLELKKN